MVNKKYETTKMLEGITIYTDAFDTGNWDFDI